MSSTLSPVIGVDASKCKNCHACITACPVKYCIDGSGETVKIDHDRCIGCGRCISACTHHARFPIDDSAQFFHDLGSGAPVVAIVAPAAAARFSGQLGQLVAWLRDAGAKAIFDASFGAELCAESYRSYLRERSPSTLISQPCPAIVTYIELYRPELLAYLAPVDSPILHSAKMIRSRYPEYASAKIAAITPCLAKKREFEATGIVDYNVAFVSLMDKLKAEGRALADYSASAYDGPVAERAAGFPLPGGLMRTLERDAPEAAAATRTIEGPDNIYPYLDSLASSLESGIAPLVVDCLNCAQGCIVGPGSGHLDLSLDQLKNTIDARISDLGGRKSGGLPAAFERRRRVRSLKTALARYGEGVDFDRRYVDRSGQAPLARPSPAELERIYAGMDKKGEEDIYDCSSCGYGSCEDMAVAIYNGLNKGENCHHFQFSVLMKERSRAAKLSEDLHARIVDTERDLGELDGTMKGLVESCANQAATIEESTAAIESMINSIRDASTVSEGRREALERISHGAQTGGERLSKASEAIAGIKESVSGIGAMSSSISDIAERINLLAMNAAIEAAHAGKAGKGFAVISGEVKRLAEASSTSSSRIANELSGIAGAIGGATKLSLEANEAVLSVMGEVSETAGGVAEVLDLLSSTASGSNQLMAALKDMRVSTVSMHDAYERIARNVSGIARAVVDIRASSESSIESDGAN
jgi:iron only hydrogenase large subunit-like protein